MRKQGKYTQVGLFGEPVEIDLEAVAVKELRFTGSFGQQPTSWSRALELMRSGKVDTEALISHQLPLAEWREAFSLFERREGVKLLLDVARGMTGCRGRLMPPGAIDPYPSEKQLYRQAAIKVDTSELTQTGLTSGRLQAIQPRTAREQPVNELREKIESAVNRDRLLETATALIEVPSPTLSAADVAGRLEELLRADGFEVERPVCDWPESPAVVARLRFGEGGRVLQVDGHLDTVHLPFVPPGVEDGVLHGSGCSDMKGGIAAAVEAMRVLRECGAPQTGGMLLTAHDQHEGPWGDGRQMKALIAEGYLGDGVMLPEYLSDFLPVAGRGMFIFEIAVTREGEPVHEVLRPQGAARRRRRRRRAGYPLPAGKPAPRGNHPPVQRLRQLLRRFPAGRRDIQPGAALLRGEGDAALGHPGARRLARREYRQLLDEVARKSGAAIRSQEVFPGDAFEIGLDNPLVTAFQRAHRDVTGAELPVGAKPFVDDGNTFISKGGIPALTHGPAATGAHTLNEQVPVAELERLARVYALTAVNFCGETDD